MENSNDYKGKIGNRLKRIQMKSIELDDMSIEDFREQYSKKEKERQKNVRRRKLKAIIMGLLTVVVFSGAVFGWRFHKVVSSGGENEMPEEELSGKSTEQDPNNNKNKISIKSNKRCKATV